MQYFGTWVNIVLYIVRCEEDYNGKVLFSLFPSRNGRNQMINHGKYQKKLKSSVCYSRCFWMGIGKKRDIGINDKKCPFILSCFLSICEYSFDFWGLCPHKIILHILCYDIRLYFLHKLWTCAQISQHWLHVQSFQ